MVHLLSIWMIQMKKTSILLNDPTKGLIIMPGIWFRTHSYVDEGVSLVLADQEYQKR